MGLKKDFKERKNENLRKIFPISKNPRTIYYPKEWAEKVTPIESESISSWMIRTALANLTDLSSLLEYIAIIHEEIYYNHEFADLDFCKIPKTITFFRNYTGVSKRELRSMSFSSLAEKVFNYIKDKDINISMFDYSCKTVSECFNFLWKTSWESRMSGQRFCPLCLKEDKIPFFRKGWRLKYITFCHIHNCFLEEKCPNCGSFIAPHRIESGDFKEKVDYLSINQCYSCGFDLSKITPNFIEKRDFLLKASKEFIQNPKTDYKMVYRVILKAWEIANHPTLTKLGVLEHPLTKEKDLQKFKYRVNKTNYFKNIKMIYLIFGTAIKELV